MLSVEVVSPAQAPRNEPLKEAEPDLENLLALSIDKGISSKRYEGPILLIGLIGLLCAILTLDLMTESGVAIGMLYIGPILLSLRIPLTHFPYFMGGVCTLLTILGVIFSPGVNVLYSGSSLAWIAVINRMLTIVVLWITAYLVIRHRRGIESKLTMATIAESSHDAIIGQTLQGVVTSWNHGAEEIFGYTEEESLGRSLLFLFPPDLVTDEEKILAILRRGEAIRDFETIRRRKDGQDINVSITISPIKTPWGKVIGASKIVRDITHKKRMEIEVKRQHTQLIHHAEALRQSNEDLEQFAYIASHDLQEPLRTINGFTQLLAQRYRDQLDDQAKEFMDFVTDAANRMQSLIQDLLKFSRVQSQKMEITSVNVEVVLQELLEQLTLTIEETHASITYKPLPIVQVDQSLFRRVLQNLISNAIKYQKKGTNPQISIFAQELPEEWQLVVQDNGIGIAPEYQKKIFLPFKRLHSREEFQGTGIGLAICHKIVQRWGGRMFVESEIGKGSKFSFTIPKIPYKNILKKPERSE